MLHCILLDYEDLEDAINSYIFFALTCWEGVPQIRLHRNICVLYHIERTAKLTPELVIFQKEMLFSWLVD